VRQITITLEAAELQADLGLASVPADWQPRYNVAPTQPVGAVLDASKRELEWLRWGLVPGWAKDIEIGSRLINARSETLAEKPSFRQAFARRRCLIVADGFFEWQRFADKKAPSQPYHFKRLDGALFAFAGLWETWRPPEGGEPLRSCTIITTSANAVVRPVHDRMPVMLSGEDMWRWLEAKETAAAQAFLRPYPAELMKAVAVGRVVNDPGRDIPETIVPVQI
jgi:putative SOS response-associated peptidase YedK